MPKPNQPIESPQAAQAFADFVAMGPGRSLRKLIETYRAQTDARPSTRRLATLTLWSTRFRWQERLTDAISAKSDALLSQSLELDAQTFMLTSVKLRQLIQQGLPTSQLIQLRESVRKPMPKGATSVSVNVDVTVEQRRIVEEIAKARGIDADELMAEVMGEVDYVLGTSKR